MGEVNLLYLGVWGIGWTDGLGGVFDLHTVLPAKALPGEKRNGVICMI